jgi:RluA family pseudouridine synthase
MLADSIACASSRAERAPVTQTLLELLERRFPDSSRTTLRQMLAADRVLVNGRPERNAKRAVGSTDAIEIGAKRRLPDPRTTILHEDADLIVIDKPAGLLTVPSARESEQTAVTLLEAYRRGGARRGTARLHVVQRLDRAASGVLVFAKNAWAKGKLEALFKTHEVERVYLAIVHGRIAPPAGTFRSWLAEDRALFVKSVRDPSAGKEAITHYRTLGAGARYSRLEVTLETGRRNQIRVHLAEAGHPIVGDTRYGPGRKNPLGRLGLHAASLGFRHPRTGRQVTFEVPVPHAFRELKL